MRTVSCIECGSAATLVGGERIYPHRPDLFDRHFWLCGCGAYCGCHPGTKRALGNPCGPETREARKAAHAAFDPLWKRKGMSRREAYAWLSKAMDIPDAQCHIGMMTAEQAKRVVEVVAERIKAGYVASALRAEAAQEGPGTPAAPARRPMPEEAVERAHDHRAAEAAEAGEA